ncbi:VOC family protein [Pimelobacter simplex]|uniref:VOC family protein n=1 Tax=Nocardioides simplex TaxID=2045 RepID=UPI003AAFB113
MPGLQLTDICLVTRDIEAAIAFYTDKLGYQLKSRMPGFADFTRNGVILAVWDASLIREATGVPAATEEPAGHGVMMAVELSSPAEVDSEYARLSAQGVEFYSPPRDHVWNARCAYFAGPCGEFWELFAWHEGGAPGAVDPS